MDRSEAERRVVAYVDQQEADAVRLLQELVRVRSLAPQEGTTSWPGTLVFGLRRELGLAGGIKVVEQTLGPTSQNLIEAIGTFIGGGVRRVVREGGGQLVERGGTNPGQDWCEATIDMGYPPGRAYPSDLETFPPRMMGVIDSFLRERVSTDGWDLSLSAPTERGGGFPCALGRTREEAAAHWPVASALRVGKRVLGYEPDLETPPVGTDATVMMHRGRIPTLVEMGAAGSLSHDYHEFVERDMIAAGAKVLALMAMDVLGLSEEQ